MPGAANRLGPLPFGRGLIEASRWRRYSSAERGGDLLAAAHNVDPPQAARLLGHALEVARRGDPLVVDRQDQIAALEPEIARGGAVVHVEDHDAGRSGIESELVGKRRR